MEKLKHFVGNLGEKVNDRSKFLKNAGRGVALGLMVSLAAGCNHGNTQQPTGPQVGDVLTHEVYVDYETFACRDGEYFELPSEATQAIERRFGKQYYVRIPNYPLERTTYVTSQGSLDDPAVKKERVDQIKFDIGRKGAYGKSSIQCVYVDRFRDRSYNLYDGGYLLYKVDDGNHIIGLIENGTDKGDLFYEGRPPRTRMAVETADLAPEADLDQVR